MLKAAHRPSLTNKPQLGPSHIAEVLNRRRRRLQRAARLDEHHRCKPVSKPTMPDDTSAHSWKDDILKVRVSPPSAPPKECLATVLLIFLPPSSGTRTNYVSALYCFWSRLHRTCSSPIDCNRPPDRERPGVFPVPG